MEKWWEFSLKDIKDLEALGREVDSEALRIFESSHTDKHGRTLEQIRSDVRRGKVAERWLIESQGYSRSGEAWHDLVSPDGEIVEVKAYSVWSWKAPSVVRDLERYRKASWCKAQWYMLFSVDSNGTYRCMGRQMLKPPPVK